MACQRNAKLALYSCFIMCDCRLCTSIQPFSSIHVCFSITLHSHYEDAETASLFAAFSSLSLSLPELSITLFAGKYLNVPVCQAQDVFLYNPTQNSVWSGRALTASILLACRSASVPPSFRQMSRACVHEASVRFGLMYSITAPFS